MTARGKILVMDDDDVIRLVAGKMLEDLHYSAEFAESGEEAIEKYRQARLSGRPFDAVIVDLTIRGGMGGLDCMRTLLEIDPDVKAIVSSGCSEDPDALGCEKYGFKGLIIKPYRGEDLGKILRRAIGEKDKY
jgi:two-component system cell cycle sensor histidine kinase/response regulator CckA